MYRVISLWTQLNRVILLVAEISQSPGRQVLSHPHLIAHGAVQASISYISESESNSAKQLRLLNLKLTYMNRKHIARKHTKSFKCCIEGCNQPAFGLKTDLERHVRCRHATLEALQCPIDGCKATFSRRDNMLRHIKQRHEGSQAQ